MFTQHDLIVFALLDLVDLRYSSANVLAIHGGLKILLLRLRGVRVRRVSLIAGILSENLPVLFEDSVGCLLMLLQLLDTVLF